MSFGPKSQGVNLNFFKKLLCYKEQHPAFVQKNTNAGCIVKQDAILSNSLNFFNKYVFNFLVQITHIFKLCNIYSTHNVIVNFFW